MAGIDETVLAALLHPALAPLWAAAQPAFVWSGRDGRPLWANRTGLRLWGCHSLAALATQELGAASALAQLTRIAQRLPADANRIERVRFFCGGRDMNLACLCSWLDLGGERVMLVNAIEALPEKLTRPLTLTPRDDAGRLLDRLQAPLIALSASGELLLATALGHWLLERTVQPRPDAENPRPGILATLARSALAGDHAALVTAGPNIAGLQAELQVLPLDAQGGALVLAVLHDVGEATNDNRGADLQPQGKAATGPVRSGHDEHRYEGEERMVASNDAGASDNARTKDLYSAATPLNVFPFTGAPIRIRDEQTGLEAQERDAFREIAKALGARIEGDPHDQDMIVHAQPPRDSSTARSPRHAQDTSEISLTETLNLLDRVPNGILIYRDDKPVYANRVFLDLFGYPDFADLSQVSSIADLLPQMVSSEPQDTANGPAPLLARSNQGGTFAVLARLQAIRWAGRMAMLLNVREAVANGPLPTDTVADAPGTADAAEPEADLTVPANSNEPPGAIQPGSRQEELSVALALATDGVITLDSEGLIAAMSDAATILFGRNAADCLGQPLETLFQPDSQPIVADYLDGVRQHGITRILGSGREVTMQQDNGNLRTLYLTLGRIGSDEARRFCAVLRDISPSKQNEEELVRARKAAENASAQKSEFLAKVSHEIRTPLNSIIGFSEIIIEERFGGIENERYRTYIRDIHASGRHLLGLVNDLLDLSKIEAGKLELDMTSVDINEVARHSLNLLQPDANRGRIILRQSLDRALPSVVADRRSLHQILLNLLSNAVKFTEPGGQVVISTKLTDKGEVQIRVRDTGIGMSSEQLSMALEPFRQLHRMSGHRAPGTGLGLPLTKALVEANRARFTLSSAPQEGTLVEVTFPSARVLAE